MLKQLLSRLETVHRATTREEREAVYRFRYQVYVEEFGRELGSPDHGRRWVTDADDDKDTTTILYTGSVDKITGTVRVRHWRAGEVPHHDFEELSMDRFPDIDERNTAEIGRLMVRPSMRGKVIVASLVRASYELLAGEQHTDLVFCYCSPGLVRYYQHIAMRPFGGRPVLAPDGIMLPLVAVMSNRAYYRQTGSFLTPLVRRYFGPGKRRPIDLEPYRPLFAPLANGIELDAERVWEEVERTLLGDGARRPGSLLAELPAAAARDLVGRGLIVDVPAGTLVTRQGFREAELYVVLGGRFDADADGRVLGRAERGELFGEDALLDPGGRRTASVRAIEDGRVLVLRGRSLEKLLHRDPTLAEQVTAKLAEVFARRLPETPTAASAAAAG